VISACSRAIIWSTTWSALTGVLVVCVEIAALVAVEETGFTEAGCDAAACSAPCVGWACCAAAPSENNNEAVTIQRLMLQNSLSTAADRNYEAI
jgi:hypothetical protein